MMSVRRLLLAALAFVAASGFLVPARSHAAAIQPSPQEIPTSSSLPVDSGAPSVIPLPNSGRRPESSGDRGGWEQLLLFGIMTAGCALIFGRVLWAARQRSRANMVAAAGKARDGA